MSSFPHRLFSHLIYLNLKIWIQKIKKAFIPLTKLKNITLDGNPLICDCDLKSFKKFLIERGDTFVSSMLSNCDQPYKLENDGFSIDLSADSCSYVPFEISQGTEMANIPVKTQDEERWWERTRMWVVLTVILGLILIAQTIGFLVCRMLKRAKIVREMSQVRIIFESYAFWQGQVIQFYLKLVYFTQIANPQEPDNFKVVPDPSKTGFIPPKPALPSSGRAGKRKMCPITDTNHEEDYDSYLKPIQHDFHHAKKSGTGFFAVGKDDDAEDEAVPLYQMNPQLYDYATESSLELSRIEPPPAYENTMGLQANWAPNQRIQSELVERDRKSSVFHFYEEMENPFWTNYYYIEIQLQ
jgi:hypothetical protein